MLSPSRRPCKSVDILWALPPEVIIEPDIFRTIYITNGYLANRALFLVLVLLEDQSPDVGRCALPLAIKSLSLEITATSPFAAHKSMT